MVNRTNLLKYVIMFIAVTTATKVIPTCGPIASCLLFPQLGHFVVCQQGSSADVGPQVGDGRPFVVVEPVVGQLVESRGRNILAIDHAIREWDVIVLEHVIDRCAPWFMVGQMFRCLSS